MHQDSETPSSDQARTCAICKSRATRLIISNLGHWKLCGKPSCFQDLTDRYSEGHVTWIERLLPD